MRMLIEFVPIVVGLASFYFTVKGYKNAKRKQHEEQGNPPTA